MILALVSQFHIMLFSIVSISAFNQEKAEVGAFSVIVKSSEPLFEALVISET